ncbi:Hypothetical predicted protein [Mytilus galloprovincialis]|uniref:Uncharacterized protein n=1 Tax=Mytilus galloprovincialis TaxID=29158 RepID=A0A8B6CEQ8_MYTGA|nr:Hypothetical predicted protein [Mytilus galloprovincialis]
MLSKFGVFLFLVKLCSSINLNLNISTSGYYNVNLNFFRWLQSAPTYFIVDGTRYNLSDKSLYSNASYGGNGVDEFGFYQSIRYRYYVGKTIIDCSINTYDTGNHIVFEQKFVTGVTNSRPQSCSGDLHCYQQTTGTFPSFYLKKGQVKNLGYLNFGGSMLGNSEVQTGQWDTTTADLTDGMGGGPIAIFDEMGNTVIISPLDNFMSSSFWHEDHPGGRINFGVMGGAKSIPANYRQRFILLASSSINQAFQDLGKALRKVSGASPKKEFYRQNDVTLKYLGYWTDNGAYYYYNTEANKTYEQTMKDVFDYAQREKIPYRYLQLDSWWYYKGFGEGVKEWTARPEVFPHGIQSVQQYTRWPMGAHNKYWSVDNVYAKQNGGKYNFVMSPIVAVPNDTSFWYDLMKNATSWGLKMYEQDWLNIETLFSHDLAEDLSLGERWLTEMGNAAEFNNITIQYCMSLPRHGLMSTKIPVVTQARASEDYHVQEDQWKIGVSSMFAYALGLAPSKDTFWTSTIQNGNPKYPKKQELWPALQTVVATLSMGPVGPGDMIGATNKDLLMRCCNMEGLILKPSRPATAMDLQIIKAAFPDFNGPDGQVWTSLSEIYGDKTTQFGILLAANMSKPYKLRAYQTEFPYQFYDSIVFPYNKPEAAMPFNGKYPLNLNGCTSDQFCLFYLSPIIIVGQHTIAIYGEHDKFVPMSPQRVTDIIYTEDDMVLQLVGVPSEKVVVSYLLDGMQKNVTTVFSTSRTAHISLVLGKTKHVTIAHQRPFTGSFNGFGKRGV